MRGSYEQARSDLDGLADLGISYDEVVQLLEEEGVNKFEASWSDLLKTVSASVADLGNTSRSVE